MIGPGEGAPSAECPPGRVLGPWTRGVLMAAPWGERELWRLDMGLQRDGTASIWPKSSVFLSKGGKTDHFVMTVCAVGTLSLPVARSRPGLGRGQVGGQAFPPEADATFEHRNVFRSLVGLAGEWSAGCVQGRWSPPRGWGIFGPHGEQRGDGVC